MKQKGNTKKLWGIINSVIKKITDKTSIVACLEIDKTLVYDSTKIANEFGKYFTGVGKTFAKNTKPSKRNIAYYTSKIAESPVTMFLHPTDALEIAKLIDGLKAENSSGHDNISNCLLKGIKDGILTPLSLVINKSLQEGYFPNRMKNAELVPLYKSKNWYIKTNYRPISLLPTLSKLLEKVIYSHTYQFMETTSQIYDGQFGFRSKHSCENAIQNLVGDIIKGEDQGLITTAVFLDLSKAFDTLNHPILFEKLYKYGIWGLTLDWFKSYLSNRHMRVKCQTNETTTCYSESQEVTYGAPQGSCLCQLLFSLFTNDISKHLCHTKCILFADDTTIYMLHRNSNYLTWCIEQDLESLSDWFRANLVTLNEEKSITMTFHLRKFTGGNRTSKDIPKFAGGNITVNNITLPEVTHTKFLAVWIDNTLTWNHHLSRLYLKLKRNYNLLKVGKNLLNTHAKKTVYFAQIDSHISYCTIIWANMIKCSELTKLQKIQNKCFKLCTGQESSIRNYHSNHMLRIDDLVKLVNIKHSHKVQHSHLPKHILECSKSDSSTQSLEKKHKYNTRQ